MLRPSKYNHICFNDDGELLIANMYSNKMCKVSQDNAEYATEILRKEYISEEDDLILKMQKAGVLIDSEEDEDIRLKGSYLEEQSKPILLLTILPTEQCNFRCVYCPEEFSRGKMSEEVQKAIIRYVRQNINAYTGLRVSWFGGEPLLAMDVIAHLSIEFMKICKSAHRSYTAGITTNAYRLTYDVFRELLSYNVLSYQITLDGLKRTHDAQRMLINKNPTYETIVKNLIEIHEKSKSGKFVILLRTNFTQSMIPDIPEYFAWYNKKFAKDKRFRVFAKMAGDYGGERVCSMKDELIRQNQRTGEFFEAIIRSDIHELRFANRSFFARNGAICDASRKNAMVIDSEGTVRKCACHLNDDKGNKLGNVLDLNSLQERKSGRMRWSTLNLSPQCKECFFVPVCMGMTCVYANIKYGYACCPEEKIYIDDYFKLFDRQGMFGYID